VLPYWGNIKQRKTIRKFFSSKKFTERADSPFHVVITSYQLTVTDEKTFKRLKWQFMILDEAQAIKNILSQRWNTLKEFQSRNRLLLTGTPIQNNMAELWALLNFVMPDLFDSHELFNEWFSKDIEAHSQDQKELDQIKIQRLHAILKPFMLRRIKKDVEHEIGKKYEHQILCEMTKRQKILYESIKEKLNVKELFKMFESKAKVENLMNLVMQLRKVCNHPELFERRPARSPFSFQELYYYTGHIPIRAG
jgi:DNA helicase INO80